VFEDLGYFKEYYINNKFIGTINCDKDREEIGYFGRKNETLESELILSNNKKIKKGETVQTILYPLCGKLK
jgi:hypothetical protein